MIAVDYVSRCVNKVVKSYHSTNPFEIAEMRQITVNEKPLGKTLGLYMKSRRAQFITLNTNLDDVIRRFVCSHELGHAILCPSCNTSFLREVTLFSVDRIEMEANEFATLLLTYDVQADEGMTKKQLLELCGVPDQMERFI